MAYTSLSVLKDYLGVPSATSSEDTPLTAAIAAAQDLVDGYCNTTFETVTEARVYRADDPDLLLVDQFRTLTGLVVKTDTNNDGTYDTTLTITTDYLATPFNEPPFTGLLNVSDEWPRYDSGRPAVQVTAAYGDQNSNGVPYAVQQAALILAARLYQRRASVLGIMTGFQDYGIARISRQDPDVAALLAQYRVLATA
tara:strand:+ start:31 stop:621 length:591 start_codon:yes stop_codon:yes gene_type:complete